MLKLIVSLVKWCFNVDEVRTKHIINKAIDGTPLTIFYDRANGHGWSIQSTDEGIYGAMITASASMKFSSCKPQVMAALSGKLDHCLTQKGKDEINEVVKKILANDGVYNGFEQVAKNKVEVVERKLTKEEIILFSELVY